MDGEELGQRLAAKMDQANVSDAARIVLLEDTLRLMIGMLLRHGSLTEQESKYLHAALRPHDEER